MILFESFLMLNLIILARQTKVLSKASIHLTNQPVGSVTPLIYRLGSLADPPSTIKIWKSWNTAVAFSP